MSNPDEPFAESPGGAIAATSGAPTPCPPWKKVLQIIGSVLLLAVLLPLQFLWWVLKSVFRSFWKSRWG